MEFITQTATSPHQVKTAALAVGIHTDGVLSDAAQALDRASSGAISAVVKSEFSGKPGRTLVLRQLAGVAAPRIVLVGLGKAADYGLAQLASAEAAFAKWCVEANVTDAASTLAGVAVADTGLRARARTAVVAAGNALYRFDATLGKANRTPAPALRKFAVVCARAQAVEVKAGVREGAAVVHGMALARELGNLPGNVCTPAYLGDTARALAKQYKTIKAEVLGKKQIEALNMGSFLSVARGSVEEPRFIVLRYKPEAKAPAAKTRSKNAPGPIVLVGKGITFDAGGISLKPGLGMDEMKFDMCGAASVFGTFRAVAELALEREVIGLIPACENLPSGCANKPGDVVTSMSGQTIEILNTDAEGRLVLCDALTYAERFKPSAVIDIATLTGACVVALGHVNSGLYSTNDALADALLAAGRETLDTAWRMPLDDAYQEQLKSNFADIANIGGPPAGSVTAACFLARFTKAYDWAHLDIAGTAWKKSDQKGATGRPVPLLVQYLLNLG